MNDANLVLASDLTGRPVVTIIGGDDIAEIKDTVFDPRSHRLVGFSLNKRGWFRGRLGSALPADRIRSIGPDAVMIDREGDLDDNTGTPGGDAGFSITGTGVLTRDGTDLGEIDDVVVQTSSSPEAVGYRVHGPNGSVFVPISAQMALSEDNIILPGEADAFIRNDLAGFGAAVADYRAALDRGSPAAAPSDGGDATGHDHSTRAREERR